MRIRELRLQQRSRDGLRGLVDGAGHRTSAESPVPRSLNALDADAVVVGVKLCSGGAPTMPDRANCC